MEAAEPSVNSNFDGTTIAGRFGLAQSPTLLTSGASPMAFSRVKSDQDHHQRSLEVLPEAAYSFQVMLKPLASDVWIGGRHIKVYDAVPGNIYMFDLTTRPSTEVHTPFDFVRFYMRQATLDELAVEKGLAPVGNLSSRSFGRHDGVMHGLALAVAAAIDRSCDATALFIDYIGLAFHSHIIRNYAETAAGGVMSPGILAPWQFRRARDFMLSRLDSNLTIAELAGQCGLSQSHFARAFRRTTGLPPHAWMTAKRVEKAKTLLAGKEIDLADIALACGFADQSHFTRTFNRHEGRSPGRWRKLHLS
jgi:AraC-like DNA-binding protein